MKVIKVMCQPEKVLPNKVLKPAQRLLQRMNQTTKYKQSNSGMVFASNITSGIKVNGNLSLRDYHHFVAPVKKDVLMQGEATLRMREPNVSISFDKKSGAITSVEPPHMASPEGLKNIFKKMQKHLNQAERDFKKKGVVQKEVWNVEGYTQKAIKGLEEKKVTVVEADTALLKPKPSKKSLIQRVCEKLDEFLLK